MVVEVSVGEDARLHRQHRTVSVGEVAAKARAQNPLVFLVTLAVHRVGVDLLAEVMVLAELETGAVMRRQGIETAFRSLHVQDGESRGLKMLGLPRLGPKQHLAFCAFA